MRKILILTALLLSACGGAQATREISPVDMPPVTGMKYQDFRNHDWNKDGGSEEAQKRFLKLDRDNNGVLSQNEMSGY